MKVRADEHVSRKIVRAISDLALSDGWELTHVRDLHERRTADETWIPRFAADGGKAILSGDRKIRSRPNQIKSIRDSGLICIFLPSEWASSRRAIQAAFLIYWWSKIEFKILQSQPTDCWLVPFEFSNRDLEPFHISFDKLSQKVKSGS